MSKQSYAMSIINVKSFSIPVSNQDHAEQFYVGKLGFEFKKDKLIDPERRWVEVGPKRATDSVTLVTWFRSISTDSAIGVVLETNDIDKEFVRLKKKGITFNSPIQSKRHKRFVSFKDPDGNELILQQASSF